MLCALLLIRPPLCMHASVLISKRELCVLKLSDSLAFSLFRQRLCDVHDPSSAGDAEPLPPGVYLSFKARLGSCLGVPQPLALAESTDITVLFIQGAAKLGWANLTAALSELEAHFSKLKDPAPTLKVVWLVKFLSLQPQSYW